MGIFRKSLLLKVLGIDYVYALLINGNPKSFGIFQIKGKFIRLIPSIQFCRGSGGCGIRSEIGILLYGETGNDCPVISEVVKWRFVNGRKFDCKSTLPFEVLFISSHHINGDFASRITFMIRGSREREYTST